LRYEHVEEALAKVMDITPQKMGAFRARIRHLRKLSSLRLQKPGSGRAIDYSRQNAFEMFFALELQNLGYAPRKAAFLAGSIVRMAHGQDQKEDCYVIHEPGAKGFTVVSSAKLLVQAIKSSPRTFLVINTSDCVRGLDKALSNAN